MLKVSLVHDRHAIAGVEPAVHVRDKLVIAICYPTANLRRVSDHVLERLAVVPTAVQRWLVEALVPGLMSSVGLAKSAIQPSGLIASMLKLEGTQLISS